MKADAGNLAASAVVERYAYDGFGKELAGSSSINSQQSTINSFRFSTKQMDAETSLNYYGYRFYSADAGRWINRDPINERGGENLYESTGNNVVLRFDRLGLDYELTPDSYWTDVVSGKAFLEKINGRAGLAHAESSFETTIGIGLSVEVTGDISGSLKWTGSAGAGQKFDIVLGYYGWRQMVIRQEKEWDTYTTWNSPCSSGDVLLDSWTFNLTNTPSGGGYCTFVRRKCAKSSSIRNHGAPYTWYKSLDEATNPGYFVEEGDNPEERRIGPATSSQGKHFALQLLKERVRAAYPNISL